MQSQLPPGIDGENGEYDNGAELVSVPCRRGTSNGFSARRVLALSPHKLGMAIDTRAL
jgi:hypothetical protein